MKTTKENIERLIDNLADKTLSFGCEVEYTLFPFPNSGGEKSRAKGVVVEIDKPMYRFIENGRNRYFDIQDKNDIKILGHPIMIGDILEKITNDLKKYNKYQTMDFGIAETLLNLWYQCGFTKSFQQIIEDSGFGNMSDLMRNQLEIEGIKTVEPSIEPGLKDPNARALAEFLFNIFTK